MDAKEIYIPAIEALKAKVSAADEKKRPLLEQISAIDLETVPDKQAANHLCKLAGIAPLYPDAGTVTPTSGLAAPPKSALKFRIDQFVNKELSDAVSEYLEARKTTEGMEGPATIDEIYEGLLSGGYKFGGSTDNPSNHKRAMNIALTRNTAQMHKINDTTFALRRWYGLRASPRKPAVATSGDYHDLSRSTVPLEAKLDGDPTPPAAPAQSGI